MLRGGAHFLKEISGILAGGAYEGGIISNTMVHQLLSCSKPLRMIQSYYNLHDMIIGQFACDDLKTCFSFEERVASPITPDSARRSTVWKGASA